jgi:subtilisin family serine protease
MTMNYRADHVLVRADEFRPGDIGRLNDILDHANLGRPLGDPDGSQLNGGQAPLISVPVRNVEPVDIQAAVQAAIAAAGPDGGAPPALMANPVSEAGTLGTGVFFKADGKKSGHGMGWVPAPADEMPIAQPWDPAGEHPVIALLDSGVQMHPWLSGLSTALLDPDPPAAPEPDGPPFLLDADGMDGWHSPIAPDNPARRPFPPGTHWGHGTFIAGLIRQAAPHAQVLSMRVMDSRGRVDDQAAVNALCWLYDTRRANIVLMAFGRPTTADDPTLHDLRAAVAALTGAGVTVIASAGNDGSDQPVYPAAFATELGPEMVSVGALMSPAFRAPFSNYGPWVTAGWLGTDIVSISPQTLLHAGQHQTRQTDVDNPVNPVVADSYAWWSGTSFAAAIAAGQLASGGRAGFSPMPKKAEHP